MQHLLHQSADHGERDHPESRPDTVSLTHSTEVSTTTNTDVFSCDVFMLQYRYTAHLPDLYIDVHVSHALNIYQTKLACNVK